MTVRTAQVNQYVRQHSHCDAQRTRTPRDSKCTARPCFHLFFLRCIRLYVALHSSGVRGIFSSRHRNHGSFVFIFGGKLHKPEGRLTHSKPTLFKCFTRPAKLGYLNIRIQFIW